MDIATLYVPDRHQWRAWLAENHQAAKEIWLICYKKHTGQPSVPYDDAVEEALCFGWIDSIVRKIDEDRGQKRRRRASAVSRKPWFSSRGTRSWA